MLSNQLFFLLLGIVLIFVIAYFFGLRIRSKKSIDNERAFWKQENAEQISQLEQSYAEDLSKIQKELDQANWLLDFEKDSLKREKIKVRKLLEFSGEYFKSMFDDLNSQDSLKRFQQKRHVRDFIFSRIKTFVTDVQSI